MAAKFARWSWIVLSGLACASCDHSSKQPADTSFDSDTALLPTDTASDSDTGEPSWEGVSLTSLKAPDRTSVRVVFDRDPGAPRAADPGSYSLRQGQSSLEILAAVYDAETRTAVLTTAPQVLGLSYMFEILEDGAAVAGLTGVFVAADTASFWVADWSAPDTAELQIVARRAAVGEHCVLYVEEGMPSNRANAAAAAFDEQIYGVETAAFAEAPDQDGNGRITILWLDGQGNFGGYFNPVNTYPSAQTEAYWGLHSNEMELLHLDAYTMAAGETYFVQIAAHEFQHLLYNHRHGNQPVYWAYHDEGLAEMAVHLVTGNNDYAVDFFFSDSQGLIGGGLSLVNWTYALYENYALAYMFWTYVAAQAGGLDVLGEVFDLSSGDPEDISAFLEERLQADLPEVHRRSLIASMAQAEAGVYGYGGMLDLEGRVPPAVPPGTASLELQPFSGAFFPLSVAEVDYPGTQGEHIRYVGINGSRAVDTEPPFDVSLGALFAYNAHFEYDEYPTEHSGPDLAAAAAPGTSWRALDWASPTFGNPPPVTPDHAQVLEAWKAARRR